jgi:hypothetical protein
MADLPALAARVGRGGCTLRRVISVAHLAVVVVLGPGCGQEEDLGATQPEVSLEQVPELLQESELPTLTTERTSVTRYVLEGPDGRQLRIRQNGEGCGSLYIVGDFIGNFDIHAHDFPIPLFDWAGIEDEDTRAEARDLWQAHSDDCWNKAVEAEEAGRVGDYDFTPPNAFSDIAPTGTIGALATNCGYFYNAYINGQSTINYDTNTQVTSSVTYKYGHNQTTIEIRTCADSFGLTVDDALTRIDSRPNTGSWTNQETQTTWIAEEVFWTSTTWPFIYDYRLRMNTVGGSSPTDTARFDWVFK